MDDDTVTIPVMTQTVFAACDVQDMGDGMLSMWEYSIVVS